MKLSLRNKFLLPTLIIMTLALGAATLVAFTSSRAALRQEAEGQVRRLAAITAASADRWLAERRARLEAWARRDLWAQALARPDLSGEAGAALGGLIASEPNIHGIWLLDPAGRALAASAGAVEVPASVGEEACLPAALAGATALGRVVLGPDGNPEVPLAVPVRVRGRVAGALVAALDLATFNRQVIDTLKLGQTGYAYMYCLDGKLIAHPDASLIGKLDMDDHDFGRRMRQLKEGLFTYVFRDVYKVVGFTPSPAAGWTAAVTIGLDELMAPAARLGRTITLVGVLALGLTILCVVLVVRGIARPLDRVSQGLGRGAQEVAVGAGQAAASAAQLAQGSSEQAAAVEETSAALNQVAALSGSTAELAARAARVMDQAQASVGQARQAMARITGAMASIDQASSETSKIIKSIDEIAFQTNLLALNAAVEAARAGEAGAGFAVVAEEVRHLASGAAEASRDTGRLVATTREEVSRGSSLVGQCAQSFDQVLSAAEEVSRLVAQIDQASGEQARGIESVTGSVSQIEAGTQQVAANAEETATAAEEMHALSRQLEGFVEAVEALVHGGANRHGRPRQGLAAARRPRLAPPREGRA